MMALWLVIASWVAVILGLLTALARAFGAGASCNTAAKATCSGTFDAVSFAVDWRFAAKFDAYAGLMFSQVNNGLANVYLNRNTIDPTVALRFRF